MTDLSSSPLCTSNSLPAEQIMESAVPIDGGWHIKDLGNGLCVDVMKMLYNYRIVTSSPGHRWNEHGWCYFGHGIDSSGTARTMATAKAAAFLAAAIWDGDGDPPGHDKQAF